MGFRVDLGTQWMVQRFQLLYHLHLSPEEQDNMSAVEIEALMVLLNKQKELEKPKV